MRLTTEVGMRIVGEVRMAQITRSSREVTAFKRAIQAWVEKHDLAEDTMWWSPEKFYGDKRHAFAEKVYLVLTFEGDLYYVLWCQSFNDFSQAESEGLRREFDGICARHGFWFEFDDNVTASFMACKRRTR
jgi:hypothetical protein